MVEAVRGPGPPAREKEDAKGMLGALSPKAAAAAVAEDGLSDLETASSTGAPNSSLSSASSAGSLARCSSLSFDCSPSAAVAAAAASCSPRPVAPLVRPHRSGDAAWAAIRALSASSSSTPATPLGPADFKLVRRVGGGDIGTVYLCRLRATATTADSSACLYAMKVVDRRLVARKRKLERAAAERRILRLLDHPFLPTLFADFDAAPRFSCVVTEFCPGGDLHSLRHRMPARRFPLASARFYAAEVLLALEYLHMMGVVYRDLKPENVLIRADGHIMLTDFDLSLESVSLPSLELLPPAADDDDEGSSVSSSCFPVRFRRRRRRRPRRRAAASPPTRRFVAEPVSARSSSFVGTHEYVAPEVAAGGAHGAAVDWWAYGVFLYELLHGRTPFAGATNEDTLRNIVRSPLAFPVSSSSGHAELAVAHDLIARLLAKDPAARLGSVRGAADVKAHPFFRGLNLALLRSSRPPVVPGAPPMHRSQSWKAPASRKLDGTKRFDLF